MDKKIMCLKQAFSLYQSYISLNGCGSAPDQNFTTSYKSVCSNTSSAACIGKTCPIVLLFVVDNKEELVTNTGKCRLNITCKISTTGSCNNYNSDGNSSTAQYMTQETTQKSISSLVSKYVNETSTQSITQNTTTVIELESTPVVDNTTLIQESPKNGSHIYVYECTSTTGMIIASAFIGLSAGVLTTGSISFFLQKRRTLSFKRPAVSHPLYNLNGREASLRATAGETYNEIENDSNSLKILYVLPITKDQSKSNGATSNPEIYNHLREDYAVKDKSNYYNHAMPLNGPQEVESEHYGKLTIKENGAYSTVTNNTNKTGSDPVRNEAYSTIETTEFQLVEPEGNDKDSSASYFVLAKE